MSFTHDLKLPTYDDLECPVVNVSSPALRAGSFHLAKYCDLQFKVSLSKILNTKFGLFFVLGIYAMSTGLYGITVRERSKW
jgi:hypothetical protein